MTGFTTPCCRKPPVPERLPLWPGVWRGILACLLTAVAFTNLADLARHEVDLETADVVGTVALCKYVIRRDIIE